jgi:hypothetical protein
MKGENTSRGGIELLKKKELKELKITVLWNSQPPASTCLHLSALTTSKSQSGQEGEALDKKGR